MPVERLPVVVASGLIGYPGLEIGMARVWVIVLVILAVIPVVPLVRFAVRGLPPVVDMDVVVLLAVERLLLVFGIVLRAPLGVRGLLVAVVEVRSRVVVLGVLIALTRSGLPVQDWRSHEHHRRQQPQEQHQSSQLILLSQSKSLIYFPTFS